jgi:inorganic pyrophosphatase
MTGRDARFPEAFDSVSGWLNVVVEAARGSRNKFKFDPELGMFKLDKILPAGAIFPHDFGFIPSTLGEDGDPLDLVIIGGEPTFTGCLVSVRLLGVIEAEQTEKGETLRNDRLIGAPLTKNHRPEWRTIGDVPDSMLAEIEHFFVSYNRAENREFVPLGRRGPKIAARAIDEGAARHRAAREARRATAGGNSKSRRRAVARGVKP